MSESQIVQRHKLIELANDRLNRIYFWVTVDGAPTYSNVWAHGADARTLFPQPDVLNNCR
jgi:hypothetical protein